MSNTSTITPYDDTTETYYSYDDQADYAYTAGNSVATTSTTSSVQKFYELARWLAGGPQPTEEQLAKIRAIEQEYQAKMEELEASNPALSHLPKMTTLNLHMGDLPSLLETAVKMGYSAVKVAGCKPDIAPTLLQHVDGTRIAISLNRLEKLSLHSVSNVDSLRSLVSHHAQQQVLKHLADNGMQFHSARLPNGELQIVAQDSNLGQPGGAAQIKAQVRSDGATWIDIDKCKGNRCETIVQQFATTIGGKVSSTRKKDAFFQLPGEPTKTQVKL